MQLEKKRDKVVIPIRSYKICSEYISVMNVFNNFYLACL